MKARRSAGKTAFRPCGASSVTRPGTEGVDVRRKTRLKARPIRIGPVPLRAWSVVIAAYLLATAVTNAAFMADTHDYVTSILTGVEFWEFGHLLWRPLGWLLFHALAPLTGLLTGAEGPLPLDARAQATLVLLALNWLARLAAALLLTDLVGRM